MFFLSFLSQSKQIFVGIPRIEERLDILRQMTLHLVLDADVCLETLAEATPGFVGADLCSLVDQAVHLSLSQLSCQVLTLILSCSIVLLFHLLMFVSRYLRNLSSAADILIKLSILSFHHPSGTLISLLTQRKLLGKT